MQSWALLKRSLTNTPESALQVSFLFRISFFTWKYSHVPSAKVSGIHWWYTSSSHAAEVTAGYYNTNSQDAYAKVRMLFFVFPNEWVDDVMLCFRQIAQLFKNYDIHFDFTALEMTNSPNDCGSAPESLVKQTILAGKAANIRTHSIISFPQMSAHVTNL